VIALGVLCVASVVLALLWRLRMAGKQRQALARLNVSDVPLTRLALTPLAGARRHDA
jgi:hypothetical protein